jgi:4-amino-4-deoxy-L-arabinose transferase-like glycosyltransferase
MTVQAAEVSSAVGRPWWLSRVSMGVWWVLGGLVLTFAIGVPPVQRTQEARVLETAREMLGGGVRAYMVPVLNGNLRVRKPPLTYWLAAGAYKIGGVSEAAGRLPTGIMGWLTLLATYLGAQWLFGRRAGFFASGTLLTSYLFFRHTRLAETDAPAMLFVTAGVLALWRGAVEHDAGTRGHGDGTNSRGFWWFHSGAVATALAVMAKGPPGFYPPLFLLGWCVVRRQWAVLFRFLTSGALLTFAVIAAPWFIYILKYVGIEQWKKESDELLGGDGHGGTFLVYFPQLIQATAPWFLIVIGAIVAAFRDLRGDWRLQGMLVWVGAVFVPLCFVGNKQTHYLMTLMPPLMILSGWWLDWVLGPNREQESRRRVPLLDATMLVALLGVPAILVGGRMIKGRIGFYDVALAVLLVLAFAFVGLVYLRRGLTGATVAFIVAAAVAFVPAVGVWVPLSESENSRTVARELKHRFGDGPYCFYGSSFSLPLCFNLRSQIPLARGPQEVEAIASRAPGVVVIAKFKSNTAPPPPPIAFEQQSPDIDVSGQSFRIYKRR